MLPIAVVVDVVDVVLVVLVLVTAVVCCCCCCVCVCVCGLLVCVYMCTESKCSTPYCNNHVSDGFLGSSPNDLRVLRVD